VSEQNGAVTEYTFAIKTTNYIIEGDILSFTLPAPTYFSEDSKCFGVSPNLRSQQPCTISTDLATITVTIDILSRRRQLADDSAVIQRGDDKSYREDLFLQSRDLRGRNLQTIESGGFFEIRVTNI